MYIKLQLRDKYVSFEVSYGGACQIIPNFITSQLQWGRMANAKFCYTGIEIRSGTTLSKNPRNPGGEPAYVFKDMNTKSTTYAGRIDG